MKDLTFIIPVRHPDTIRNPEVQRQVLQNTCVSIAQQIEDNWRAVIVANRGLSLPDLPKGVEVAWVDYGPNPQHDLENHDFKEAMEFVRLDKGRRVWAGMQQFPDTRYFMVFDDDDFVSRHLSAFVGANLGANGWYVDAGYGMNPGGQYAMRLKRFHKICGSSHIVRADLYQAPAPDDPEFEFYLKQWLGSHGATTERFEDFGAPLAPLPFPGAVYLVNNPNSHSRTTALLRQYIITKDTLRRPWSIFDKLSRLKRINNDFRAEFLGGP